jgi:outer membrane lipopolysaccharide assembly protein LptE/RlpB
MKIIKIFLILNFIVLSSCGYKALNNLYDQNFGIINSEFSGNKKINRKLERNFAKFNDITNASRLFAVKINSELIRSVTSKDSAGKEASYSIEIIVNVKIYENSESISSSSFEKKTNYNNLNSQFELKQYEIVLVNNLVDQIIIDLNNFIGTIK